MPGRTLQRFVAVAAVVGAGAAAYLWWNRPERRIEALLAEVAGALTCEAAGTDLGALASTAGVQGLLAPSVLVDLEPPRPPLRGRQDVMATLTRVRATVPMMRLQFFDADIELVSPVAAIVRVTAQVTTRGESGGELADARQVTLSLVEESGRWTIADARLQGEPAPR